MYLPETSERVWNWMQSTVSLGVFMQSGSEQAEVRWCQWRVKSVGRIDTWMTDTCKMRRKDYLSSVTQNTQLHY